MSEHLFLPSVNIYALCANSKFNPINGTKIQAVCAQIQAVFSTHSLQIKPLVPLTVTGKRSACTELVKVPGGPAGQAPMAFTFPDAESSQ